MNHLARTNTFLKNSRHKLATRYNDQSPLENNHIATLYKIMKNPECDIFENCDEHYNEIRKNIINNILYTDIGKHFDIL